MANIIAFPNASERDWRGIVSTLRDAYKDMPDGQETIEECIPILKTHWKAIFVSFSIQVSHEIPSPLTREQTAAVSAAVEQSAHLVAERLKNEREQHFALLVASEYKAAFYRRTGKAV